MAEKQVLFSKESIHTMGTWKARKIAKKARGSQTSGRSKGLICSPLERWMCRANRSWKHPLYARVLLVMTGEKRIQKKK